MDATLTVSSQGQITLPKAMRDLLGVTPGSKVIAYLQKALKGHAVVLEPKPKSWYKLLAGSGKGLWGENSDEYLRRERESWDEDEKSV